MKNDGKSISEIVEKHSLTNLVICLIDKKGRIAWVNLDPHNDQGISGKNLVDSVVNEEREKVYSILSRCILKGETVEYITHGEATHNQKDYVTWRVIMWPMDVGQLSACCIACR